MAVMRPHHTGTSEEPWDGPETETRIGDDDKRTFRRVFAWVDEDNALSKTAAKFPHHDVTKAGKAGAANIRACTNGVGILNGGRGGADISERDRRGIYRHLAVHLKDAGEEPPELRD